MNARHQTIGLEVGLNVPAEVGMRLEDVSTPALIVDLDAFERNVRKKGKFARTMGVRHRAHAKTHKSLHIARVQMNLGDACGICCQKVSEAEVMVAGSLERRRSVEPEHDPSGDPEQSPRYLPTSLRIPE